MFTFESVLNAARQLSPDDRMRLMDALWDMEPHAPDPPLHPSWKEELDRRVREIEADPSKTIPWETVRENLFAKFSRSTNDEDAK
jgi:putative addiction module component (TIGR02574 family)